MSNSETGLTTMVATMATMSEPVKTSLWTALSKLLGGLIAFPAAWERRPVQAVEDVTDGRALVTKGLAQLVLDNAKNDPDIIRAATEVYLPNVVAKVRNRASVARLTVDEVATSGPAAEGATAPDEDWMNSFMRYAEDASSDRLQGLFGKILAGQIINPGAFSPSTLRLVSELTQEIAQDLEWLLKESIGDEIPLTYQNAPGANWLRMTRLKDAGLVSPVDAAVRQPEPAPTFDGAVLWRFGSASHFIVLGMRSFSGMQIDVINLTKAGLEISRLISPPDYRANLVKLAASVQDPAKVAWIDLHGEGRTERVWQAAQ